MTRRPASSWTVVNPGRCPACGADTDAVCERDRHRCAGCGADRGQCDRVSSGSVVHTQQLSLLDP